MNTLLLIPDGIGVRNFVLGTFLTELRRQSRATILHDLPAGLAEREDIRGAAPPDVEWRALQAYKEEPVAWPLPARPASRRRPLSFPGTTCLARGGSRPGSITFWSGAS